MTNLIDKRAKPAVDGRFRLNEPAVVADVIDGETIIMNLEKGDYYSLNASGGELWQLLLAGQGLHELLEAIAERHGVAPSTAEVEAFIARLIEYRLIVAADRTSDADAGAAGHEQAVSGPWTKPEISVYSDMKDLLALDPHMPPLRSHRD